MNVLGELTEAIDAVCEAEPARLAGEIDANHVAALAEARTPVSTDCFEHDEAMLVDQAARLSHRPFSPALAYWCQRADPDGTEDRASAEFNARRLHLSQSFGGGWVLDGSFDPIGGAVL